MIEDEFAGVEHRPKQIGERFLRVRTGAQLFREARSFLRCRLTTETSQIQVFNNRHRLLVLCKESIDDTSLVDLA